MNLFQGSDNNELNKNTAFSIVELLVVVAMVAFHSNMGMPLKIGYLSHMDIYFVCCLGLTILASCFGILVGMIPVWFPEAITEEMLTGCSGRGCLEYIALATLLAIWVIFHILYIRQSMKYLAKTENLRMIAAQELSEKFRQSANDGN